MKAIILAAGRGSRLGDLTEGKPKCLVEIFGRPLLYWQLAALRKAGISDIAIVRGYQGHTLEGFGTSLFDNPRWAETNMVMSLAAAGVWLCECPCVISYADIFYAPRAVRSLITDTTPFSLTYDNNWHTLWSQRFENPLDDAETFRAGSDGRIQTIGGKPKTIADVQGQYMGLLKIAPEGWNWVTALLADLGAAADTLDMTGMIGRLIERGCSIQGIPYNGLWGEIDNPSDIAIYQKMAGLPDRLFETQ